MTMFEQTRTRDFALHDYLAQQESFEEAMLRGLSARPKTLPYRFLYDARGSALFDRITTLPEYYLAHVETEILRTHAGVIADCVGEDALLIELGSGSSIKTRIVLDALRKPFAYVPIDVSRDHLCAAAAAIAKDYPNLRVEAICADYSDDFPLPHGGARRVAFFPGSTLGNWTREEARALLAAWHWRLGGGGLMIVGIDLRKSARILNAAYDDSAGVTRAFIKNILLRANAELGANFDLHAFVYEAAYQRLHGRVEMHLVSTAEQSVRVAGRHIRFAKGERILVETSHKYSLGEARALARAAGFTPLAHFVDDKRWFSVHVWRARA